MEKYQWVAYGLDMFGYVIVETEGVDINDSHNKALKQLQENKVDFDTLEPFDNSFISRMNWLKK